MTNEDGNYESTWFYINFEHKQHYFSLYNILKLKVELFSSNVHPMPFLLDYDYDYMKEYCIIFQ